MKLGEVFGSDRLENIKLMDDSMLRRLLANYRVHTVEELPEEGYSYFNVRLFGEKNTIENQKRVVVIISEVLNIDPETIDFDEDLDATVIKGEMSIGSASGPWPTFAIDKLDQINSRLSRYNLDCEIYF